MIEQKQKQQQEQLRKQQEAEKEMKRIEELKLEKRRLELQKQEQQKQELQRQELQRAEQKHLQEEQRRQILEQQRQEQEYLQQQEQLRQQEVMRAQKEVERQQRELEKRRMEKERVEREARERAEWLEHQHKLEMQKIETQRAELQRKERERQLRLKQIDDERVAREKQELERQDTQRQQILAEQQKQLLQKYQGVSPGPYVTPTQQSIAEKAEKLKQVAAYFSQQKYNLTHGAVPSSPPRSFTGAPGSFPMIAIPKLYQSPFGAQQAALAPAPAPGFHGSPKLQMPGAHHSPGFFNSPGMTSIGSSPRQNFGNTYSHFPNPFNNPQQFQQPALQQSCHYRANQFNSFGQYNPQAFQATVGFCTTKEEAEPKLKEPELKDKPAMIEAIPQADLNPKECLPTEEEQVEEEAVSTSRVHIDGEWFKVPTAAVKDVNDGYCEVNFNGDKVKVEKAKVEKVKVEKACVVDGDVDVEQIVGKYEVFANKKWNIVQANNITPSKKQPGTYIVKLNERCIRVNPECLRLINEKPFREARAGEGGTSSGTSIQPKDSEISSAQISDKPGNSGPDRVDDGPVGGGGRGPERGQPPIGGDPTGPVKKQNEQSDVKPGNNERKERKGPKPASKISRTDTQRYPLRKGAAPKPRSCYFGKGFLPEITGVQSKRTCAQ